jgi:O-antigen ligase
MAKNTQDCLFPSPRLPVSGEPLESFGGWKAALALSMVGAGATALFIFAPWSAVLVGVAAVLTVTRWPYGALLVLIGASAMPGFLVQIFRSHKAELFGDPGWNARPEHFAVAIVSVALGLWLLGHKREMRLEKLDYWLIAYMVINCASSAFGFPDPSATLRWALMSNLAILPYFLIRLLIRDLETLGRAFWILLSVGIAESAYGILCYASRLVFGTVAGLDIGAYGGNLTVPYGSLYEPNLFGAYTACCAVLFLALYLCEGQHRFGYLVCVLVALLATVLSVSRGALFALLVALGWVFWKARRLKKAPRNKLSTFILAFGLILVMAATVTGSGLQERFGDLYQQGLGDETTVGRLVMIQAALQEVPKHPLLGSGTASTGLTFDVGGATGQVGWVGNVTVRILHDTGLLGLTVLAGFLISLWWRIRRGLRGWNSHVPMLIALSAGALLYGISFQFTDGTILAFCWVLLGLLASAAILMKAPGANGVTRGET